MIKKQEIIDSIAFYLSEYPDNMFGLKTLKFVEKTDLFWSRQNLEGHLTASSWVVNDDYTKVILCHHGKLNIWVQLGGHIDETDNSLQEACRRELEEESGLTELELLSPNIYDIDIHHIPANKGVPEHLHYDLRLIFKANSQEMINFDIAESKDVRWIRRNEIIKFSQERAVLRMVEKMEFIK
jgi:ADP-ribose pyrophosphatase YjhB (NUDIX family)